MLLVRRPKQRTTLMVSEGIRKKIKLLAAIEGKTVVQTTEDLLRDAIRRRAQELRNHR